MKKISMVVLVLLFILTSMAGCGGVEETGEAPKESLDISGDYTGTMTFSKVEIVYDSDEDSNGVETRSYYEPSGESEWLGESVDVNYKVMMNDDQTVTLTGLDDDGENTVLQGDFDQDQSKFYYATEEIGGKNELVLTFADEDGTVTAKGTMLFTHEETGLVNEIIIDLKKI